ncbi:hypothetical protein CAMSH0001_0186 [Campylobacter showae RM3277]|uniref:Uncharacterized protein n=1 Tax=Campylobacter showae RM3277 TaxID=553219 RepID=C6RJ84_9BACT|nr:hypothetical protein CAMSH0001_0186 [Campylobacter showae RM3277]
MHSWFKHSNLTLARKTHCEPKFFNAVNLFCLPYNSTETITKFIYPFD